MTKDEALRLALDALYGFIPYLPLEHDKPQCDRYDKVITAIKAALEAKDEPVAWSHAGAMPPEQEEMKEAAYRLAPWLSAALDDPKVCQEYKNDINAWFDAAMPAPQRTWVGLTDEDEIDWQEGGNLKDLVKAIEAKLKAKNT